MSIKHVAKFFVDSSNRIVADREYNTNSYVVNSKENINNNNFFIFLVYGLVL